MATILPRPGNRERAAYFALGLSLLNAAGTTSYAILGLQGKVPITVTTFLLANLIYFVVNAVALYILWTRRHELNFLLKVFLICWTGTIAWYTLPMSILILLTVQFDNLQRSWLMFGWMWEVPVFGAGVLSIFALILALPIHRFIKNQYHTNTPGKLYQQVIRYPLLSSIAMVSIAIAGFIVGAFQIGYFGHIPLTEEVKIMIFGSSSSIFYSIFYYLAYDTLLRNVRQRLERGYPIKNIIVRHYARRVSFITLLITVGSLLMVSLVVFKSYQQFITQKIRNEAAMNIQTAQRTLESTITRGADYEESLRMVETALRQGGNGYVVTQSGASNEFPDLSQETKEAITTQDIGIVNDARDSYKVVSFFREPVNNRKIIIVTQLSDFYGPLVTGMQFFTLAGLFVLLLTAIITTFASSSFSRSIRQLSEAVRHSQRNRRDFTFDTNTADELEDLAHAFRYYINQSNELQRDLERKVEERTAALVRIEEEKRLLEVKTAQQAITTEQQKRQVAEQMNLELEGRVKERTVELEEAVRHLQELDKVKSEFISIASHQLRTPLTVIRWSYQSLLDETAGKISADQQKVVSAGLQKTLFMIRLVNNLLDITRIEGNKFKLEYSETQIDDVLEEVVSDSQEAAKQKNIAVLFKKLSHRVPTIWLDKEKIQMALSNIVDNAIKYTSQGSVTVSLTMGGGVYTIKVQDTGIGIPQDQVYRLFTKFFRTSNAVSLHTDGSGLGLYIAKTVIEKHGGVISVESEEGKGTTFIINLPATQKVAVGEAKKSS